MALRSSHWIIWCLLLDGGLLNKGKSIGILETVGGPIGERKAFSGCWEGLTKYVLKMNVGLQFQWTLGQLPLMNTLLTRLVMWSNCYLCSIIDLWQKCNLLKGVLIPSTGVIVMVTICCLGTETSSLLISVSLLRPWLSLQLWQIVLTLPRILRCSRIWLFLLKYWLTVILEVVKKKDI